MPYKLGKNRIYNNIDLLNAPINLTQVGSTTTSIDLSWSAPFIIGSADQFKLYRVDIGLIATLPITTTTYQDTAGLTEGTQYSYYLTCSHQGAESSNSSTLNASTPAAGLWQLAPTNYIGASITNIPLQLIFPRPEAHADSAFRWAHSQMRYEFPIGVRGGAYPYKYEIISNGGATGLSIGETLATTGNGGRHEVTSDYGVLSWDVPVGPNGTTYDIELLVRDQEGGTIPINFTLTVDDTKFIFHDDTAIDDSGTGTILDPFKTFYGGFYRSSDSDATFVDKIAVFRAGSYTVSSDVAATTAKIYQNIKPRSYLGFTGELATFVTTSQHLDTRIDDLTIANIQISGMKNVDNGKVILMNRSGNTEHARYCFYNIDFNNCNIGANDTGNNPGCMHAGLANTGEYRDYCLLNRCKQTGTTNIQMFGVYNVRYSLIEHCVADGITLGTGTAGHIIHHKLDSPESTVRHNVLKNLTYSSALSAINASQAGTAGAGPMNCENCYNLVHVVSAPGTNRAAAVRWGAPGDNSQNFIDYRNSYISTDPDFRAFYIAADNTDPVDIRNNIMAVPSFYTSNTNAGGYTETNIPVGLDASIDIDVNLEVTGSAATYLGTHGREII